MASEYSEAEIGSTVEITQGPERRVIGIAHDDMIENFNFEKLACSDEVAGYFDVRFRRRRFPARMIMLCEAPIYVTHTAQIQHQWPSGLALSGSVTLVVLHIITALPATREACRHLARCISVLLWPESVFRTT